VTSVASSATSVLDLLDALVRIDSVNQQIMRATNNDYTSLYQQLRPHP
jgi:hypothetical protein